MKPFLGIDLTTNKKNEIFNGDEFLIQTPSPAMVQALERSTNEANKTISRSMLPLPLRIVQLICEFAFAVIVLGTFESIAEDGLSLKQIYQNASWLYWLAGICVLTWCILTFLSTRKTKSVLDSDESTQVFDYFDGICDAIFLELSVPTDAAEVDILFFHYKVKNGEVKICEKGAQIAPFISTTFVVYTDTENLYFANLDGKYAFPLTSLVALHTVKKRTLIATGDAEDNDDCISSHCHYILEVNHNNEAWGIYIPCHELDTFEELTGLKAD